VKQTNESTARVVESPPEIEPVLPVTRTSSSTSILTATVRNGSGFCGNVADS
jgi:hypothetical protein